MDIIGLRQQVRAFAADHKIDSGEAAQLQAAGLTSEQVTRLKTNAKDGGGLSEGELMEIVHSTNTELSPSAAAAPAPAPTPAAAGGHPTARAASVDAKAGAKAATATRASSASLDQGSGVYKVQADSVYLRTHSGNGLVRGELHKGDTFEVHQVHGGYAYGYAPRLKKWGWMRFASGQPGEAGSGDANIKQARELPKGTDIHHSQAFNRGVDYVRATDKAKFGVPYTLDAGAKPGARLFLNVVGGKGTDPVATDFAHYQRIGVRYAYDKDWFVVLAKDASGKSHWGFMRKDALNLQPDANYQRWLDKHPDFAK